ncbi:MAG: hypothetical protein M0P55_15035, partial [Clostridiales bacterium]|nr:hypothetical protein [Clostridiales bacterium]
MHQVFNMGHRMELYCLPDAAQAILSICRSWSLDARIVGYTEAAPAGGPNEVVITREGKSWSYLGRMS